MAAFGSAAIYFDEIVAKIGAGKTKREVLASDPRYPTAESLYAFAKKQGRLDEWRKHTDQRGKCEEHFDAILMAIRSGLSTRQALLSDPNFPRHNSLCAFLRKHPHQRFRHEQAVAAGNKIRLQVEAARNRIVDILDRIASGMTEEKACEGIVPIHSFRRYVDNDPTAAAAVAKALKERERGPNAIRRRRLTTYTEAEYNAVLAAIRAAKGNSIRKVFDSLPESLPGRQSIYSRVRRDPAFAARFGEACRGRNTTVSQTYGDLVSVVEKLVPKHLDPAARADIIGDLVMAVLSGEITQKDIAKSVKEFIRRFNKKFSAWEFASLDKPLGDDNDFSLGDMATSNEEVW